MSIIIPDQPATMTVERVRLASCSHCCQEPGKPCTPAGDHLARWQRAERGGYIGQRELAAVVARLEVIAPHVVVEVPDPRWLALARTVQDVTGMTADDFKAWAMRASSIPEMESLPLIFAAMADALNATGQ